MHCKCNLNKIVWSKLHKMLSVMTKKPWFFFITIFDKGVGAILKEVSESKTIKMILNYESEHFHLSLL